MNRSWLAAVAAALMFLGGPATAAEPLRLKVLYAGNPGSTRARDFITFLEKHFVKVGTSDFRKFKEEEARDYDVVLFDWTSIYPRNKEGKIDNKAGSIELPSGPRLSADFAKPTVLIGAAGGQVAGSRQLKINWL
jgi:hypothetical protein